VVAHGPSVVAPTLGACSAVSSRSRPPRLGELASELQDAQRGLAPYVARHSLGHDHCKDEFGDAWHATTLTQQRQRTITSARALFEWYGRRAVADRS